jgi:hypothetical protein
MATTEQTWGTIHIFGFGTTQLIGKDLNKQVPSSALTTLNAVIQNVYSLKPTDVISSTDFHAINLFNDMNASWLPKTKEDKGFRVEFKDLDITLIDALVAELEAYTIPTAPEVVAE